MKFLTKKDIEILKIVKELQPTSKSNIGRKSNYLSSNLDHTFKKLDNEGIIKIVRSKNRKTTVTITKKGSEVINRL